MTENRLERFLRAIGYPERASGDVASFAMRVDGMEIVAEEANGRIVLSFALTDDASVLPLLASYAAGRMLREGAVLAYGIPSRQGGRPRDRVAFLWQDAPADADERSLVRLFETFADSCDWWRTRLGERGGTGMGEISEAVIIP